MSPNKLCLYLVYKLQREAIFLHYFHLHDHYIIITEKRRTWGANLRTIRNAHIWSGNFSQALYLLTRILFYFFLQWLQLGIYSNEAVLALELCFDSYPQ